MKSAHRRIGLELQFPMLTSNLPCGLTAADSGQLARLWVRSQNWSEIRSLHSLRHIFRVSMHVLVVYLRKTFLSANRAHSKLMLERTTFFERVYFFMFSKTKWSSSFWYIRFVICCDHKGLWSFSSKRNVPAESRGSHHIRLLTWDRIPILCAATCS